VRDAELAAIRARADAVPPRPWVWWNTAEGPWPLCFHAPDGDLGDVCTAASPAIAEFVAGARDDVPRLLAEVDRLRAEVARLRGACVPTTAG
jgi:hypothetical protein